MEEKLRKQGKTVPAWVIEAQKRPSCSLKVQSLGLPMRDQDEIIARILKRNRETP